MFEAKQPLETICVASPWRGKDKFVGLAYITNMLAEYKIPFKIYYDESSEQDTRSPIKFNLVNDKVLVFSYHMLKGLEFDHTIIFDTYHDLIGRVATKKEHAYHKYLIFVALTRAKKTLWICNLAMDKTLNTTIADILHGKKYINIEGNPIIGENFDDGMIKFPVSVTKFIETVNFGIHDTTYY